MKEKAENTGKRGRWKRTVAIVLASVLGLLVCLAAVVYGVFKISFYGKSNYVKGNDYTIAESIPEETYIDESGEVQVIEEPTLPEYVAQNILDEHEAALEKLPDAQETATGTYNLLLIGVDRRNSSWNGNSDVMMLVTVNYDRKTIYLTSFLRDLYANIPGVGIKKLNASCAYGGAPLCVETIKSNYGVMIDNYAMVDFNAMIDIVDILGGVDLELDDEEVKIANDYIKSMCKANGVEFEDHRIAESGLQHLDGYQAVGYARNRYSGGTYDFGRTERQRKVVMSIFNKMKGSSLSTLTSLAQNVLPYVTHNVEESKVLSLLSQLPDCLNYSVEQQHIPYSGMYHSENEILIPDMEATISKLLDTIY